MKLAVIAGDGIGPEVIDEALQVLDAVLPGVEKTEYDLGARRYHATGEVLPASVHRRAARLRRHPARRDRRPVGAQRCARTRPAAQDPLRARPPRQPAAGTALRRVSPVRCPDSATSTSSSCARAPRVPTPGPVVRSGSGTPHEVATEVSLNTAFGVNRVVRDAFTRAQARRKHLTLVHKTNVLTFAGGLWSRVVDEVGAEYPDVEVAYQHIDAATIHMVTDPGRFDVIVTDNLFGDIITDLAAAVCGGIGLAASGNIDATRTEPVDVRAGARQRARHRGQGHRRPHRRGDVGGAAAGTRRRGRRRRPRRQGRRATIWRPVATRPTRPARSASGSAPRSRLPGGRRIGRHQRQCGHSGTARTPRTPPGSPARRSTPRTTAG